MRSPGEVGSREIMTPPHESTVPRKRRSPAYFRQLPSSRLSAYRRDEVARLVDEPHEALHHDAICRAVLDGAGAFRDGEGPDAARRSLERMRQEEPLLDLGAADLPADRLRLFGEHAEDLVLQVPVPH